MIESGDVFSHINYKSHVTKQLFLWLKSFAVYMWVNKFAVLGRFCLLSTRFPAEICTETSAFLFIYFVLPDQLNLVNFAHPELFQYLDCISLPHKIPAG